MKNQTPDSDELDPDLHALHRALRADGARWRTPPPDPSRLMAHMQRLTSEGAQPLGKGFVMQEMPHKPSPKLHVRPQWLTASVSVVLIGLLALVGFAVLRPKAPNTQPGTGLAKSPTPTHVPTATPVVVTEKGVSLSVVAAQADATRTVLKIHLTANYSPANAVIIDAKGRAIPVILTQSGLDLPSLATAGPLPLDDLQGGPQQMVLQVRQMVADEHFISTGNVTGLWRAPFTLVPTAPRYVLPLDLSATHNGVTVHVQRFMYAPAPAGLDGLPGGVVLTMQVTGLPKTTNGAESTLDLAYNNAINGKGGAINDVPGTQAALTLPDGTRLSLPWLSAGGYIYPGAVLPTPDAPLFSFDNATAFDTVYLTDATLSKGTITLTIPAIATAVSPGGNVQYTKYPGPWTFTFSVNP